MARHGSPEKKINQIVSLAGSRMLTSNHRATIGTNDLQNYLSWSQKTSPGQAGCVSHQCYQGMKEDGARCPVLVGMDDRSNNIEIGPMIENGLPCPPFCSTTGSLTG